ncbi:MAG: arginine--tRNA ligase [Hyphomicrobium sp.]
MNVYGFIGSKIQSSLRSLQRDGLIPEDVHLPSIDIETPRDTSHGDLSCNVAFLLSKPTRMKPAEIAGYVKAKLAGDPDIKSVEVAGAGFLNITMKVSFWHQIVKTIVEQPETFGRGDPKSEAINIEFVSANPTGPMHVGHCRGAVFGDTLSNLLSYCGYKITKEFYINDAGAQVEALARSVYLRYKEALEGKISEFPEGLYPGEYLKEVGSQLAEQYKDKFLGKPEKEWLAIFQAYAVAAMLDLIKLDLAALNIHHDVFISEAKLQRAEINEVKKTIDILRSKNLIYVGRLPKPLGHEDQDWENRDQILFKSTDLGDDQDRALQKSDGTYTYFAGDLAYHANKLERGFKHYINIFGADHIGYIPRLLAAFAALSDGTLERDNKGKIKSWKTKKGTADLEIKVVQLVKLFKGGEPYKMSKRAGTFVTLRDVVDEVGRDAVRFMMLYRKELEPLDFDFAKVTEQSKDNPVFYVQYAHARASSVLRNISEQFPKLDLSPSSLKSVDLSQLNDSAEIELIRKLAFFPRLISQAGEAREPHRIAFYLYDLASTFHILWTRGNDLPQLRFIQNENVALTSARCVLVHATRCVISSGLSLLGVEAPDIMR